VGDGWKSSWIADELRGRGECNQSQRDKQQACSSALYPRRCRSASPEEQDNPDGSQQSRERERGHKGEDDGLHFPEGEAGELKSFRIGSQHQKHHRSGEVYPEEKGKGDPRRPAPNSPSAREPTQEKERAQLERKRQDKILGNPEEEPRLAFQ